MGISILSPATTIVSGYIGGSEEVGILATSLYILGFACGPLILAPVSELWGRRVSLIPASICLGVFSLGTALSKNAQSVFLTVFFAGVFGSAPVACVSASLGDIYTQNYRGIAVTFYAAAVCGGPTLGSVIGSAITQSYLGWRWTEYIEAIWVFASVAVNVFCLPESYEPVLLARKTKQPRKSGNPTAWHSHENKKPTPKEIISKHFARPITMLGTESIVTCIAAFYASFVYAISYLTLEVIPIVCEEERGYDIFTGSLPFLGLSAGELVAILINPWQPAILFEKVRDGGHGCCTRSSTPSHVHRCNPLSHRSLLLWLYRRAQLSLNSAFRLCCLYWCRILVHISAVHQHSCGLLWYVRG